MLLNQHRCWVAYGELEMAHGESEIGESEIGEAEMREAAIDSACSCRRARDELMGNGRWVISTA